MGAIYAIKNQINGKLYIGQTVCKPKKRFLIHKYDLKKEKHGNRYLQNAWNKYGACSFRFVVLENGFDSIDDINKAECFWIQYLRSMYYQDGYNIRTGGENYKHSEESKRLMREAKKEWFKENDVWNKGISWPEESKNKMSESQKEWLKNNENPFLGENHSEESKKKMKEWYKNNTHPGNKKCIIIKTGEVFGSITRLADHVGITHQSISAHCRGETKNQKYKFV